MKQKRKTSIIVVTNEQDRYLHVEIQNGNIYKYHKY